MITKPEISVLMSMYNEQSLYLHQSIKSIINQTFTNFEFIIINDSSNKQTSSILKNYAQKDARIVLLKNKKNVGLTKSLNIGIKKARGLFIARMDSDDISLPHRLTEQISYLKNNHYDIITSDYAIIDSKGKKTTEKKILLKKDIRKQLIKGNFLIHSTFFGTKKVFKNLYNTKIKKAQDYEFILRVVGKGFNLGNLPRVSLLYRINNQSISLKNPHQQEWFAIKGRLLAIFKYDYKKIYLWYVLRSLLILLIPYKVKQLLINKKMPK